jgi:hypothetical protein
VGPNLAPGRGVYFGINALSLGVCILFLLHTLPLINEALGYARMSPGLALVAEHLKLRDL